MPDTPLPAPESPPQPARRETVREWLDRFEAAAAGCASRREASKLLLAFDPSRAERHLGGGALERLHTIVRDLYSRFWGEEHLRGRDRTDAEENSP